MVFYRITITNLLIVLKYEMNPKQQREVIIMFKETTTINIDIAKRIFIVNIIITS